MPDSALTKPGRQSVASPVAADRAQRGTDCDLLVVGSGAGGLAAAVTAAHLGLRVIVAEKAPRVGGTSAWSGGWMWVPGNPLARQAGIHEHLDVPLGYLRTELGERFDEVRVRGYLTHAPGMVEFFRRHTALGFIDGNAIPDFHGGTPGAATGGRSVCAAPFDGRRLGAHLTLVNPPLHETTLWGMGIAAGGEMRHFLNASRSLGSLAYVLRLLARYGWDLAFHGRGTRLVNGNALIAALLRSALDAGVRVCTSWEVQALRQDSGCDSGEATPGPGRVSGARVRTPDGEIAVSARCGVLLAAGGFPHDTRRKQALLPHAPTGREHWSAGWPGNTGDGLRLGESVGGVVADDLAQAAALAPVSLVPRPDGTTAHFPHLVERAKPGLIAVTRRGVRFGNEADPYHDLMTALLAVTPAGKQPEAWLVCDARFLRLYGLGAVKPWPIPAGRWLDSGYLKQGGTWESLARACGIDGETLNATVARYNAMAREGRDLDFRKGETAYNRVQGDAGSGHPNPCMAPLERPPFYAVRIVMGSLGTFAGLRCDANARVLDAWGQAIPGLWAAGNDHSSLMAGHYPSGGITLGPAMTYGYLAAHDAAGVEPRPFESGERLAAFGPDIPQTRPPSPAHR